MHSSLAKCPFMLFTPPLNTSYTARHKVKFVLKTEEGQCQYKSGNLFDTTVWMGPLLPFSFTLCCTVIPSLGWK